MAEFCDPHLLMEGKPPSSIEWALADALDAVTNGMENPEAFAHLDVLPDTGDAASFLPWFSLIQAIRFMYAEDTASCLAAVDGLRESPILSPLVPLFLSWAETPGEGYFLRTEHLLASSGLKVAALHRKLFGSPHGLCSLAEQAEESIRQRMYSHFEGLSSRILRELQAQKRSDGALLAMRWVAHCFTLLEEEDCADFDFYALVLRSLGQCDGFIALGLVLLPKDEKAALIAFKEALSSGVPGDFLDAPMRELIEESIALIEGGTGAGKPGKSAGKMVQLELF